MASRRRLGNAVHQDKSCRTISGRAIALRNGRARATIATVGASLAALTIAGRNLVAPFDPNRVRPVYRGALLVPWPNRVVDGRYSFGGRKHQLPLNEAERMHALHGLVAWQRFCVAESDAQSVTLGGEVVAQAGYPWNLDLRVRFVLDEGGLTQSVTAVNTSDSSAPYGAAAHHYLCGGSGALDSWSLHHPAAAVMEARGERLLPGKTVSVSDAAGAFDFRGGRALGDVEIDHAFTQLGADADGRAEVTVLDAHGVGARMRWDAEVCPWVQLHTADRPEPELHRAAVAVEPMTCAPDAFNSGVGLVVLQPGASHTVEWRLDAVG